MKNCLFFLKPYGVCVIQRYRWERLPVYINIQRENKGIKAQLLKVPERISDGSRKEQRSLEIYNCWTKKRGDEYDMEKIKER